MGALVESRLGVGARVGIFCSDGIGCDVWLGFRVSVQPLCGTVAALSGIVNRNLGRMVLFVGFGASSGNAPLVTSPGTLGATVP